MKCLLALVLVTAATVSSIASDLGSRAPDKPTALYAPSPPDPAVVRQGGDTIADAVPLDLPVFNLAGTTIGYGNDYDEACPYGGSTSPDVAYTFTVPYDHALEIDLCGSSYDTKVYVYDQDLALVACNDDFYMPGHPCGDYVSLIESFAVMGGVTYYVVVDGYGGDAGDYLIDIHIPPMCWIDCPPGAEEEGEPPLDYDYEDLHNGGCNTDEIEPPLQPIAGPLFCGVSGWYRVGYSNYRDTDWFTLQIPSGGVLEITGDAEEECYMFELGPQDCAEVGIVQQVTIGPCIPNTMTISGEPGSTVWFWVGPTAFEIPGADIYEFNYLLETNLEPVAAQVQSWTGVKGLFR